MSAVPPLPLNRLPCAPCTKTELDLESVPPIQMGIIDDYTVSTGPKAALGNDGPLEFVIEKSGDDYLDLSECYLKVKLKLLKADNTPLSHFTDVGTKKGDAIIVENNRGPQSTVVPVNLGLHSLFRQVDLVMNDTLVSSSQDTYPYRAYVSTMLSYGEDTKLTWLEGLEGWHCDEAYKFDDSGNKALDKKSTRWCLNSRSFEYKGRLHVDMVMQERLIPNGVTVKFVLTKSKPEFFVMSFEDGGKYKVKLEAATLEARRVKLVPEEQLRLENVLSTTGAVYPITHVVTKSFTVSSGTSTVTLDSLFIGEIPNKIVLAFLRNDAFHGAYDKNPYRFQHFDIVSGCLYVDGQRVPTMGYEMDMTKGLYADAYQALHKHCGLYPYDNSNHVTREQFEGGTFLLAFDLTADQAGDGVGYVTPKRRGTVKGSFKFASALPDTTTVLAFAHFDSNVFIDRNRAVTSDYTV